MLWWSHRSSTESFSLTYCSRSRSPNLRRNHGRYLGERLEVDHVQRRLLDAATAHGWRIEVFLDQPGLQLHAFHRPKPLARPRIYLSSGMYADEPAVGECGPRVKEAALFP